MPVTVPPMGAVLLDRATGVLALRTLAAGVQAAAERQNLAGADVDDAAPSVVRVGKYDWRAYLADEVAAARRAGEGTA